MLRSASFLRCGDLYICVFDGIRSIENLNFPTARMKHKPRSNLVDGSNEEMKRLTLEDSQILTRLDLGVDVVDHLPLAKARRRS